MRLQHQAVKFHCKSCAKNFARTDNLKRHQRTHEKGLKRTIDQMEIKNKKQKEKCKNCRKQQHEDREQLCDSTSPSTSSDFVSPSTSKPNAPEVCRLQNPHQVQYQ